MTTLVCLLIVGLALRLFVGRGRARKLRAMQAQLEAYRRGDYLEQLKIIDGFKTKGSAPPIFLFFRGAACLKLGRLEEAEQLIRRSMPMETKPALRTLYRCQLGLVLVEQERWDQAAGCFRKCIAEAPNRSEGHLGIAESLLRQGEQSGEALDEARKAVAAERSEKVGLGKFAKEVHDHNLGESLAFLAWALARNSDDPDEVKNVLNEAFALCGEDTKPVLARVNFCAGQAYAVLGNTAESVRHFERAAGADPHGNYGRLARAAAATV